MIQNHDGQVLDSMQTKRKIRGDAFTIECFSFLQAVHFRLDAGFWSIILEADVKMEVKEVQDADLNWSTSVLLI